MVILNFIEAFKMLEIEPTRDKKEIKTAYSKMLKKYHPEEFPDVFIQINEAYKVALEYTGNEFMENDNLGTQSYSNFKEYSENEETDDTEFSDIFEEKNTSEKSKEIVYQWLKNFKSIIISQKRPLKGYKNILNEFHYNLDETEKKEIFNILLRKKFFNSNLFITEFEKQLLLYNLNGTKSIFEEIFEINEYELSKHSLYQIAKNLKSNNIEDVEKGYEKFIGEYLNIKIFKLLGKKIALYSDKNIENAGKVLKFGENMSYKINDEFIRIANYICIFDIEGKNGIGTKLSSFAMYSFWCIFLILILFFFNSAITIVVFGSLIGIALDWINIINEKDFKWSKKHGVSNYLFMTITAVFGIILLRNSNSDNIIPTISTLQCILIIVIYLFINTILFVKMVTTSRLRYERLKEFSKKVLDVFMFNK